MSMYQTSIPVFTRQLTNLSTILGIAAAHAEEKKIEQSVFLMRPPGTGYVPAKPSGADRL